MKDNKRDVLSILFPSRIFEKWKMNDIEWEGIQEIRLRVGQCVLIRYWNRQLDYGNLRISADELKDIFIHVCQNSVYAFEKEREYGYITVKGGHRIGFTGEVSDYQGNRTLISHISSMNIRIAHQMVGIAKKVIPHCVSEQGIRNTLIISPPGLGKTTLLRDMARVFGKTWNIGVIDERGEIAGGYLGIPSLDCGTYADVLTGESKEKGIDMMIRSMAPEIIVIDEIGTKEDARAIEKAALSGCHIMATVHGRDFQDVVTREELREGITQKIFERYLVITQKKSGERMVTILNREGIEICIGKPLQVA